MPEFEPGDLVVDGIRYSSFEEYCRLTPPKDPDLRAVWEAYGPKNYPPNGFDRHIHVSPLYRIGRTLFPDKTPIDSFEEGKLVEELARKSSILL